MKKILSTVVSVAMLLSMTACDFLPNKEETPSEVNTGICTVNDFESNEEFNLIRLFGVLGTVTQNTEAEYVKSGVSSAKVVVESDPYKAGSPYIEQAFELKKKGVDYRNFSDVAAVSMDVYNATGGETRMGLQLTYKYSNGTRKNFDLQEGWNTIRFSVKREYIPQYTDAYDVTAPFVEGLKIMFERGEEDGVYYLDNLKLYKTEKSYSPVTMSLKENEICSFDQDWQVELLEPEGRPEVLASYTRVTDVTATGSGSSVRVEAPGSASNLESWPGIFLCRDMTALVPWAEYPDDAYLCFDVYAPKENGLGSVWLSMYSGAQRYFVTEELIVSPGAWTTYRFSVKDMNTHWSNPNNKKYNVATTTGITMRWAEHTGSTCIVYFDNFRMEFSK